MIIKDLRAYVVTNVLAGEKSIEVVVGLWHVGDGRVGSEECVEYFIAFAVCFISFLLGILL
jgi:hypothetical protein